MFINERTGSILQYLKVHRKATVGELSAVLFASESTIRRNLKEMQDAGLIARYHGGAVLLDGISEISLFARAENNADMKNVCAEIAIRRLHATASQFNTVFIDNSSTCLALANKMDFSNKTVITNGLPVAMQLAEKRDINLIVTGGAVNTKTSATIGSFATQMLEMFNFDLALLSCAAINAEGAYELSLETAQLKQLAVKRSKKSILVVTDNKFSAEAPYRTATLDSYDCIVTNADKDVISPIVKAGVAIYND